GGLVSRGKPVIVPDDVKGLKVRGGSRDMDLMLKGAGAAVISLPSSELYAAMQTGAMDVAMTSSTSLMSFRLEELSKHITTSRKAGFYFVLEPLLMSKAIFDGLPKDQQAAILAAGEALEPWGRQRAEGDDQAVAKAFEAKGVQVHDLDQASADKWKAVAKETAWKDYGAKTPLCAKFIALAEKVPS
ncbi:MAG: TRAP transporter substrate-binding protein DctP, partial [Proteobacteria bacterium]|nr:TRAP transporter substrate-binding protein DctP [Pseudomonadota bacterium]